MLLCIWDPPPPLPNTLLPLPNPPAVYLALLDVSLHLYNALVGLLGLGNKFHGMFHSVIHDSSSPVWLGKGSNGGQGRQGVPYMQ